MTKLLKIEQLAKRVAVLKKTGKKIGLCYGAFDLLHPGHVKHLEAAKKFCDLLAVGVSCDKHIKERKGAGRPIFNERLRAYLISQLKPVDFVFINYDNNTVKAIKKIKPHFCIKGEDYQDPHRIKKNQPREERAAQAVGAKVLFTTTNQFAKIKTSKIINQIKKWT